MAGPLLDKTFERQGVSFQYPGTWELVEELDDSRWAVTLQSPGTGFISLVVLPTVQNRVALLAEALSAFQDEYEEIDTYNVEEEIASRPAVGHDLNFFCMDLTNTTYIRAFNSERRGFLLLAQCTDSELDEFEHIYREILKSLKIDDSLPGDSGTLSMLDSFGLSDLDAGSFGDEVDDW